MNFGEYVALLSGNTDLLEKVKLEKKLFDLERGYQVFLKRKSEAEFQIGLTKRDVAVLENSLVRIEADWKPLQGLDLERVPVIISNKAVEDKKAAGEQLQTITRGLRKGNSVQATAIATWLNFDLCYDPRLFKVYVKGSSGQVYNYANGDLHENPALAGRYIVDCVKRIPKLIENTRHRIVESGRTLETYRKELTLEFNEKALIRDLKNQIEELNIRVEKATVQEEKHTENSTIKPVPKPETQRRNKKQGARI